MIVKLLTEHHLEFLSLKGGCRGSSESTLVKMSNCWKSHAAAQIVFFYNLSYIILLNQQLMSTRDFGTYRTVSLRCSYTDRMGNAGYSDQTLDLQLRWID